MQMLYISYGEFSQWGHGYWGRVLGLGERSGWCWSLLLVEAHLGRFAQVARTGVRPFAVICIASTFVSWEYRPTLIDSVNTKHSMRARFVNRGLWKHGAAAGKFNLV